MVHKWLKKGALVEVYADNEWWDANCILFSTQAQSRHTTHALFCLFLTPRTEAALEAHPVTPCAAPPASPLVQKDRQAGRQAGRQTDRAEL